MQKYIWATDIHLNFIDRDPWEHNIGKFCSEINQLAKEQNCKGLLITGDISEAPVLERHLSMLIDHVFIPIYFVLGNHDFYKGKIQNVRDKVTLLSCRSGNKLHYLSTMKSGCLLESGVCLIGHDGWYDGLYSEWFAKEVVEMADYYQIADIKPYAKIQDRKMINALLKSLAREAADTIKLQVKNIVSFGKPKKLIVLTHVPPWKESCLYEGVISNSSWLPNFSSRIMGDALLEVARDMPTTDVTVFCGHTHSVAEHAPAANMRAYTGFSDYNRPWASLKVVEL